MNPLTQYNNSLLSSEARASRAGYLFRSFIEFQVAADSVEYFLIDIPVGIDVYGFSRFAQVTGDTVFSQFLTCTGFTPAAESAIAQNFDRRQSQTKKTGDCILRRVTSPTGIIEQSQESEIFVSTTPVRAASIQTEVGAQPAFDNTEYPLFAYRDPAGNNPATVKLTLFWQELPNGRS